MTATLSFDHLVLVVSELEAATRAFSAFGFTVTPGGEHAGGLTHNALIAFKDGSYLELLAPTQTGSMERYRQLLPGGSLEEITAGKNAFQRRFIRHLAACEGLADFALLSTNLEKDMNLARQRGLHTDGPETGNRIRPDGETIAWRFAFPPDESLPFLIEDITPRDLRVPSGAAREHPNGIEGPVALRIAAEDLGQNLERYRALLNAESEEGSPYPVPGPQSASFRLGKLVLTLFEASGLAMRKAPAPLRAHPHSILLRSTPSSHLFALSFSPETGFTLDILQ